MDDWWFGAATALTQRRAAALVSVLATEGSAPREAGARMAVWADGQADTIGGGRLEQIAVDQARRLLAKEGADFAVQDYPLGPLLAQCCGGRVRLLIERLGPDDLGWLGEVGRRLEAGGGFVLRTVLGAPGPRKAVLTAAIARRIEARGDRPAAGDVLIERLGGDRPQVLLLGAGHVGQALAQALAPLPFRVVWRDSRPQVAAPGLQTASGEAMAELARTGSEDAFILVLTHDHALDYAITHAALTGAGDFAFLGLIGSATKRARFVSRLRKAGVAEAQLARMTCPIGLGAIKSKAPPVIAISVAADLLQRRETLLAAGPATLAVLAPQIA